MFPLDCYIDLLENGDEMEVIVNLFDLHKKDHAKYIRIKRSLLEELHREGASPRLVKLALICFILAKMPTLDDVAAAYEYYVPLTNLAELYPEQESAAYNGFTNFCSEYPDAQSCRIYDV